MLYENLNFNFFISAIATDGMDYLKGVHGAFYDSKSKNKVSKNKNLIKKLILERKTYQLNKKFNSLIRGKISGNNFSDVILFSFHKE